MFVVCWLYRPAVRQEHTINPEIATLRTFGQLEAIYVTILEELDHVCINQALQLLTNKATAA